MIRVLQPVERKPSTAERFNQAFGAGMSAIDVYQDYQKQESLKAQENEAFKRMGIDLAGIQDPKIRQDIISQELQGKRQKEKYGFEKELLKNKPRSNQELKDQQKINEKVNSLRGAQDTITRMRSIRKKGNLGRGIPFLNSSGSPFPETRKDASEYSQLGKSLIQYATNIPIRNRLEFETLAESLYDPDITDASAEGILDAMERIIKNSLEGSMSENSQQTFQSQEKKRRPLTEFIKNE